MCGTTRGRSTRRRRPRTITRWTSASTPWSNGSSSSTTRWWSTRPRRRPRPLRRRYTTRRTCRRPRTPHRYL
ncbi:unnamed protein product [Leptidea sinapis]|uniref:Uncharacterized protein n=1 Tax=Leptidea sinapis TaxID=189913 RepID=A0A5E4QDP3_9NEOP|nr:unnamed protein product [Leptidea sinapis]